MDNLADKIIEANKARPSQGMDGAPHGFYTDDMGMWVEKNIRNNKSRFAAYVFVRCRERNPHLYYDVDRETLFNRHTVITPTKHDILELAHLAEMITTAQAIWVHTKLKETVPRLDSNRLIIAPGLAWNIEKGEFEELKGDYYTVGGEDDA